MANIIRVKDGKVLIKSGDVTITRHWVTTAISKGTAKPAAAAVGDIVETTNATGKNVLWKVVTGNVLVPLDQAQGAMFFRGAYAAGTQYEINDVVIEGGIAYIATARTIGNAPPHANWTAFAAS